MQQGIARSEGDEDMNDVEGDEDIAYDDEDEDEDADVEDEAAMGIGAMQVLILCHHDVTLLCCLLLWSSASYSCWAPELRGS